MTELPEPAAVVRAISAAWQENDLEAASRLVAGESLDQGKPASREDWRRKWEQMRAGCPDMKVLTEHSVENGEWVANRYTIRGTHTGHVFGQPLIGERF
jgi:predicted ester cyclase